MNERELLFIIRFRNEAQRGLRSLTRDLRQVGRTAETVAKRGLRAAAVAIQALGRAVAKAGARIRQGGLALREFGQNLIIGVSGPLALAAVGVVRASANFEQALTGVAKTVNAPREEIARLGEEFKTLSTQIPFAATELAGIGQVAGQLGIATDKIVDFTVVSAKLGVATDLSAEQAGISLARLSAAAGVPQDAFENLGSAVVGLGNNFAVFEGELINITNRIAPAARNVGLTVQEMLALGTATRATGIRVEAGGTAISRTLSEIASAAATGGERARIFADTMNITTKEFQELVKNSPIDAFRGFASGLADVEERGENVFGVLKQLDLDGIRVRDTLLSLSGNSKLLSEALAQSNKDFKDGTALSQEAEKFFETLSNRLIVLKNQFIEVAIAIGDSFGPQINKGIEFAQRFVTLLQQLKARFDGMTEAQKDTIAKLVLLGIAIGPVLLVFGTFVAIMGSAVTGAGVLLGVLGGLAKFLVNVFAFALRIATTAVLGLSKALLVLAKRLGVFLLSPLGLAVTALGLVAAAFRFAQGDAVSFGNVIRDVLDGVVRLFQSLGATIGFIFSIAFTFVDNFARQVKETFTRLGSFIKAVLERDVAAIMEAAFAPSEVSLFDGLAEQGEEFKTTMARIFSPSTSPVGEFVAAGKKSFADFVDTGTGLFEEMVAKFNADFLNFFGFELPEAAKAGMAKTREIIKNSPPPEIPTPEKGFFDEFLENARQGLTDLGTALEEANVFSNVFDQGIDSLEQFITTGKASFKEFARDALSQITKVILKLLILKAIEASVNSLGGSGGGVASALSGVSAAAQRRGGPAGSGPRVMVPAAAFAGAQRFQSGGVVPGVGSGDRIPALLEPGERVLSRSQRSEFESGQGRSRPITVNVNINGVKDFDSFRANKGAVTAAMAQALERANTRDN